MGDDNNIIPISDEQAKLGRSIIKAVSDAGSYVADILDDLPKNLVGYIIGDKVKAKRHEQAQRLWKKTQDRLKADGVIEPEEPSLKLALPIIAAATDEKSDDLLDYGLPCLPRPWIPSDATACVGVL